MAEYPRKMFQFLMTKNQSRLSNSGQTAFEVEKYKKGDRI